MNSKITRALLALGLAGTMVVATACGGDDSSKDSGMSGMSGMDGSATPAASAKPDAGAVDRAFVAQMIPHHEMAVQMAKDAQMMGQRQPVKRLADAIVATQTKEIAALQDLADTLGVQPAEMGSPDQNMGMMGDAKALGLSMDDMGMSMKDMEGLKDAKPFDRAFIDAMIPHHQGAIRMARAELARGGNAELQRIAKAIIAAQTKEITQMNDWRQKWYGAASPAGGVPSA